MVRCQSIWVRPVITGPDEQSEGSVMPRTYGVKLVRGPYVRLSSHPQSCESEEEVRRLVDSLPVDVPRAMDLFCGAGGLSLGLEQAGFRVVVGVDNDEEALDTHRALCGGLTLSLDMATPEAVDRLAGLARDLEVTLIAGGPPCQPFSKAGRSMLRHLVARGRRDARDHRSELWESFLQVVLQAKPPAVLMENVPEMVLDRDMLVLRTIVDELERAGYAVEEGLIDTWQHGVPQFRQRLILVGLREGVRFDWPEPDPAIVSLGQAIGDLPAVEGGWRPDGGAEGWLTYPGRPKTDFQKEMRQWLPSTHHDRLYDHITRPVREDDAAAFAFMDSSTRYSDLPERLKRYRDDIFDDKYKRLDWDELSRTITAHIAKDGYWYIHPEQDRTLTVREAARLQTFPDHVRFAGPPTAAFRQIGNAVPPRLARALGGAVLRSLRKNAKAEWSTRELSAGLAGWLVARHRRRAVASPWHALALDDLVAGRVPLGGLRWPALVSQVLFDRVPLERARQVWPVAMEQLADPARTVASPERLRAVAFALDRSNRADAVRLQAEQIAGRPEVLHSIDALAQVEGVTSALARVVFRLVPDGNHDPVEAPASVLRVAARFWGKPVDVENKRSEGRVAVARLIGVDDEAAEEPALVRTQAALAHIALFEIAQHICRPSNPRCELCPLKVQCRSRDELHTGQQALPVIA